MACNLQAGKTILARDEVLPRMIAVLRGAAICPCSSNSGLIYLSEKMTHGIANLCGLYKSPLVLHLNPFVSFPALIMSETRKLSANEGSTQYKETYCLNCFECSLGTIGRRGHCLISFSISIYKRTARVPENDGINLIFGFVAHSNSNVRVSFGILLMDISTLVITFKTDSNSKQL